MNIHARRKQVTHAVADLSEVVADILDEAIQTGEPGLTAAQVRVRSGMPASQPSYDIVLAVLHLLSESEIAVDTQPGPGHGAWRLK